MKRAGLPHPIHLPIEISAQLYIGDYFGDTLELSAQEHAALAFLLLHVWLYGPIKWWKLGVTSGLPISEWRKMRGSVSPIYNTAIYNIEKWKGAIRKYDGKRLPPADWYIVKTVVLIRDGYTCLYCGCTRMLHVDHIVPVSRGGSNAFDNLNTSCGSCNRSKGQKTLEEWKMQSTIEGTAPKARFS